MRLMLPATLALALSTAVHATDANSLLKAGSALLAPQASTTATSSDAVQGTLVDALTSKLGVTPAQASGGAGALLGLAQGKLSADDNSALASAIPGLDQLIGSAPKVEASANQASDLLGPTVCWGVATAYSATTAACRPWRPWHPLSKPLVSTPAWPSSSCR